jgi:hypothetical protein
MKGLKNYIIQGKIKFDNTAAEFGINFYGQWPDSAKKYSLIKGNDGLARLYYYSSASARTLLRTLDTTRAGGNSALLSTDHWYNYQITTLNNTTTTTIQAWIWIDTIKTKPPNPGIECDATQIETGGLVGLVSHAGTGTRYWGPMKVISSQQVKGAYLAWEDFKEDTVVDVKPYTPANMHPLYTINQFTTGTDTSGFVFQKSSTDTSMVYRHKPGTEYPVTCLIAPETNLEWRNYEFSGKIIKPAGDVYDSAGVGVVFYAKDAKNYYSLRVKGKANDTTPDANKFYLMSHFERYGSEWDSVMQKIDTLFEGSKDTMNFSIQVLTNDKKIGDSTIIDGEISINAVLWQPAFSQPTFNEFYSRKDTFSTRKTGGYCGLIFNYSNTSLTSPEKTGIKFADVKVQKVGD